MISGGLLTLPIDSSQTAQNKQR